jgi:protein gp37
MGQDSKIEWTQHTFNPWWGCAKVSPACNHCYAEAWSRRLGLSLWGSRGARRTFGDNHWNEPLRWNRRAGAAGVRSRVFCASMADVFEDRADLNEARARLWQTISATPNLDWLLLTKRPENASRMVPWGDAWPANVWLGATVESGEWALKRLPALLATPAAIHFLSCEPLLEGLDLAAWFERGRSEESGRSRIDWVIVGGESGRTARPMELEWARKLRDQCQRHGVLLHFKQWGEWAPDASGKPRRVGKKAAGRTLDGRTWDEVPASIV